ncbi:MAG: peptide ABC transporter permease [Planctomycetes bacterium SM23_32]|nr:MAG: peptide ABC transporter permease [Planctomycetes bacterium SM23_32]
MLAYVIRRTLYTVPLVLGVCLFTFLLFNAVFSPRALAIQELGQHAEDEAIRDLIHKRGWDKGVVFNKQAEGLRKLTDTRFVDHMQKLLLFRFGRTQKTHEDINRKILLGMVPSLTLTVPIFIMGLLLGISLSLFVAYFRATYLDLGAVAVCVGFMSISILVYIIVGQLLLAQHMRLFPVYGYAGGIHAGRFLLLPVLIALLKGLGGDVRFYRTILLEQIGQDYVRTARAKGLGERVILFKHVLKNAMIPVLTRTVLAIPFLFLGSLLLENFFGIPGLGNMTVEAAANGDTQVMAAMVYLGALLFALGNLLTDISYTLADPRIRLR